jgi:hypothetical protein
LAQNFGSGVGIGTPRVLHYSLKQRGLSARVTTSHQLLCSDLLNIIPFEEAAVEEV